MDDNLIRFIVNPHSRGGRTGKKWDKNYGKLQKHLKVPHDYVIADGIGTSVDLAKDAINEGITTLVSVGGEGGNNEVVNAIYSSKVNSIKLGFIRSGTVNDYQQIINWPKSLEKQATLLNSGKTVKTPVTRVKGDTERVALNIADVGVAALAAHKASVLRELTWVKTGFRYTLLALRAIREWSNIPAEIIAEDRRIEGDLSLLMAGFSTQIGDYKTLPHATIYGEELAYTIAIGFSKWQMIRLMGTLKKGNHTEEIEGIFMGHAKKIQIKADEPMIFEVDGEPFSYNSSNIEIEAIPNAIEVIEGEK